MYPPSGKITTAQTAASCPAICAKQFFGTVSGQKVEWEFKSESHEKLICTLQSHNTFLIQPHLSGFVPRSTEQRAEFASRQTANWHKKKIKDYCRRNFCSHFRTKFVETVENNRKAHVASKQDYLYLNDQTVWTPALDFPVRTRECCCHCFRLESDPVGICRQEEPHTRTTRNWSDQWNRASHDIQGRHWKKRQMSIHSTRCWTFDTRNDQSWKSRRKPHFSGCLKTFNSLIWQPKTCRHISWAWHKCSIRKKSSTNSSHILFVAKNLTANLVTLRHGRRHFVCLQKQKPCYG